MEVSTSTRVVLRDGRHLDVAVSGPEDGFPLVFHHGTPGSVLQGEVMPRAAARHGLRLITTSRAGYGGSSPKPGRRVVDVVPDTLSVLDHLGIERCLVAGWSGGGPHALACGAGLGARVAAVLAIASVAPREAAGLDWPAGMGAQNIEEFELATEGEGRLRPYLERERNSVKDVTPLDIIQAWSTLLPPIDMDALRDEEFGAEMAAGLRDSVRTGVDGWLEDDLAFVEPWGYSVKDVRCPVVLCQGAADLMVPFAHGQWLAKNLPHVTAHLDLPQGHLSWYRQLDVLFAELAAAGGVGRA